MQWPNYDNFQNEPTISIMKITGHRTEKSFLKYIKISREDNANKLISDPFLANLIFILSSLFTYNEKACQNGQALVFNFNKLLQQPFVYRPISTIGLINCFSISILHGYIIFSTIVT